MNYYLLGMTGEDKVWKKYFTFDSSFYHNNDEIDFLDFYKAKKIIKNLKIRVLAKGVGEVYKQSFFKKDSTPPIVQIDNVFLLKNTIFQEALFKDIVGINFNIVKIEGDFKDYYVLLNFTNVIDCVDFEKSVKNDFDFLSKLVLKKSQIPKEIDCFFLSGWSKYDEYYSIVSEKLKNRLLGLKGLSDFLIFDKV